MKKTSSKNIQQKGKKLKIDLGRLIGSVLLCELAGIIGSFFTFSAIRDWYQFLNKPVFSPPNFLFGPVWTTLYALMGISLYLVWKNKEARLLFLIHLFFNAIWSFGFFGLKNLEIAFYNILVIWTFIVLMIWRFQKINKTASLLLLPYLWWVTFASVLNYFIWKLN